MGGSPPFRGPSMQVSGFRIYFLEPGYFFSKILSEFRKKIVALQKGVKFLSHIIWESGNAWRDL